MEDLEEPSKRSEAGKRRKHEQTDNAFRSISDRERADREQKTAALRALRKSGDQKP